MHGDGDACVPVNSLFPDQSLHGELATAVYDGTFILQEASKRQAQMTSVLTLNPPCSDSETEKTTQAAWQRGRRDQHAPDVDPSKSDGPWLGKVAGARRPTASRRRAPPWTRCALFVRLVGDD
jgi:hypothetical protein